MAAEDAPKSEVEMAPQTMEGFSSFYVYQPLGHFTTLANANAADGQEPLPRELLPSFVAGGSTASLPPVTWGECYGRARPYAQSQPITCKNRLRVPRHVHILSEGPSQQISGTYLRS